MRKLQTHAHLPAHSDGTQRSHYPTNCSSCCLTLKQPLNFWKHLSFLLFPLLPGSAPSEAAATASDTSEKALDQVQAVADPGNVEEALNSVGDAVENAVPDPKDAPSGLAPTSPVSNSLATDEKAEGMMGFYFISTSIYFLDEKVEGMMQPMHCCRILSSMFCKVCCRLQKIAWVGCRHGHRLAGAWLMMQLSLVTIIILD